jgi:hypothetical protein
MKQPRNSPRADLKIEDERRGGMKNGITKMEAVCRFGRMARLFEQVLSRTAAAPASVQTGSRPTSITLGRSSVAGNNLSSQKLQEVLDLRSYRVANIELAHEASEAHILFVDDAGAQKILILGSLYQFVLSRHPDEEGTFLLGELTLSKTGAGGEPVLEQLGFGFSDANGKPVAGTGDHLYHLHLEGDILLDAVCATVVVKDRET